jgi:nicotinamidase-related amidase
MVVERPRTALVVTDLQNDFLSPGGPGWALLRESLAANRTVENMEALLEAARDGGYPVFVSPHYYYPSDRRWTAPGGALETLMGQLGVFARTGPLSLDGFDGSGADWPERFKPLLRDCDTVVASPHKVYGAASNDLVLQLRKRRVEKVVLFGPAGNGDGYRAAMVNFRFLAHALWTTEDAVRMLQEAAGCA